MSVFLARRGDIQQIAKTDPSFRAEAHTAPVFATSHSVSKPAGTVDGDRILIAVFGLGTNTPAISGFSSLGSFAHASTQDKIWLFTKIAASEGASWSVTGLSNTYHGSIAVTIKDGDGTIGAAVTNGNASAGATTLACADYTTTANGAVVVRFCGAYSDLGTDLTCTWATATERADFNQAGSGVGMNCSTETRATAGATGTRTVTNNAASRTPHIAVAVY